MAQISNYHFIGESEDGEWVFEGDVEVEYRSDPEDGDMPIRKSMVFSDVIATHKKSGESEYWDDQIPGSMLSLVRDIAEDQFRVE